MQQRDRHIKIHPIAFSEAPMKLAEIVTVPSVLKVLTSMKRHLGCGVSEEAGRP